MSLHSPSKELFPLPPLTQFQEGSPEHSLLSSAQLRSANTKRDQVNVGVCFLKNNYRMNEEECDKLLSSLFNVSVRTIKYHVPSLQAWVNADEESKTQAEANTVGRDWILDSAQRKSLVDFIEENYLNHKMECFDDIHSFVTDSLKITIRRNTLYKTIKELPIKVATAVPVESNRFAIDVGAVDAYLNKLKSIEGVPSSSLIVNIDESGQQDWSDRRKMPCYVPSSMSGNTVRVPVDGASVRSTLAVAISLNGDLLKPLMIVNRKTEDTELVKFAYTSDKVEFDSSGTSFINNRIFKNWIQGIVLEHFRKAREFLGLRTESTKAYIIMDGCSAHIEDQELQDLLVSNNVECIRIPAHTSGLLQPMDRGVFSAQKHYRLMDGSDFQALSAQSVHVIKTLNSIRKATCPSAIVNSFNNCGIGTRLETVNNKIVSVANVHLKLNKDAQ